MKRKTSSLLSFVIGFILIWGSIGAEECEAIPVHQFLIQTIIGFALMLGGVSLGLSL